MQLRKPRRNLETFLNLDILGRTVSDLVENDNAQLPFFSGVLRKESNMYLSKQPVVIYQSKTREVEDLAC